MCEFTHLHNHSEYSLLDGLSSVNAYVDALKKVGQKSLALTDHGNMHGAVEFYRAMKSADMHPVLGCEFYSTPFGIGYEDKTRSAGHMLVLAQTQNGYQNLLKLSKEAGEFGFYYKPRITSEALAKYSNGLITTSGCMAAYIPQAIMNGNLQQADAITKWYKDVFDSNFYVELQVHPGIPELNEINKRLLVLARKYDIKPILTNDTHYANASDAPTHDVLLCVQTKSNIYKPDRFKFTDNEYYLKTEAEMRKTFLPYMDADSIAQYMRTAYEIALSCEANPAADVTPHIPSIELDGLDDPLSFLQGLVDKRIAQVYPDHLERPELHDRIAYEMSVINQTNFANYYLIIWDICMQSNRLGISYNTRGSAAGSIVNYIIGVSNVDPIKYHLLFERFLNIARVSIPDVDLDFEHDRRQEMIDYIVAKYGDEFVCQIVTFGHMKARAAVRDVGRALAVDLPMVDKIAKSIKNTPGKPINLENSIDTESEYYSKEFAELAIHDQNAIDILQYARPLENTVRHTGIHAAALLIGDVPLVDRIPLMTSKSAKTKFVSQLDYPTSESMGMLKVDLLGLISLSIIRESCKLINERHGTDYLYENIPYDSQSSYDVIAQGNTIGIFQVENSGMTRYLVQMKPNTFGHIADMISLYRPGPIGYIPTYLNRMAGIEGVTVKHPMLESVVLDTQGIMIYQEQVNQVLIKLGGYSAGEADKVRKHISKKNVPEIQKNRKIFVDGCVKNGIEEIVAESIYDDINEFALYGFNRCVSGTTVIKRNTNQSKELTIEEMYKVKESVDFAHSINSVNLHYKYKRNGYGYGLSLCNDGRIRKNKIIDIRYVGVRQTYKLTTETGKEIICTNNHKFPTPNGTKRLDQLSTGDIIYALGAYEKTTTPYNLYDKKTTNAPKTGQQGFQRVSDGHSVVFEQQKLMHKQNKDLCEICSGASSRYELHHKDFNRINNSVDNLQWLCVSCHKKVHYSSGRTKVYQKGIQSITETIVSILPHQCESVYDVEMDVPNHNFVISNGIVTSNSHAASYARMALITAWLKSNYMVEFVTACLICEGETTDKRVKYIEDAVRNGIKVIPPQIGGSRWFAITPQGEIQFGLGAIDGIGSAMGDKIANATPDTIFSIGLKKNQLQRLVQAGCFDDLLTDRQQLLANIDDLSEYGKQVYRWKKIGQRLLYEPEFKVKTSNKVTNYSAAMDEYKALGAWLIFHPLRGISKRNKDTVTRISELTERCYIIGVVTNSEELTTKHGKRMLKFIMTDEYGSMEVLVGTKECKGLTVKDGDILHMHVNVDMNEEDFRYTGFASNITKLENTK